MSASGIDKGTTGTLVGLTEIYSQPETDSNSDRFVIKSQATGSEWECMKPVTGVWS